MKAVLDANFLLLLFRPDHVAVPRDPATGQEVTDWRDRIAGLLARLTSERYTIVIPTPALSELLVRSGDATDDLIKTIRKQRVFQIETFDVRAAIEVAVMARHALDRGDKRDGAQGPWAKVKYDRQIVAIAKINDVKTIYSDDGDITTLGGRHGIAVIKLAALPVTAPSAQGRLNFDGPPS